MNLYITALISTAALFSTVSAWDEVTWNMDGDDKHLSDGDWITLTKACDVGLDADYVRMGLVESNTWWKAITLHDNHGFLYELAAEQDSPGIARWVDVPVANLPLYHYVLSKAKTFGIHEDMYEIANTSDMVDGCSYLWTWIED